MIEVPIWIIIVAVAVFSVLTIISIAVIALLVFGIRSGIKERAQKKLVSTR